MIQHLRLAVPVASLALAACGNSADNPAATTVQAAAPARAATDTPQPAATAAPTATEQATRPPPGVPAYPEEGYTKVPPGCKKPTALLAAAPVDSFGKNPYAKDKSGFPFHFARQALLAHPEMKVVKRKNNAWEDAPAGPNEVALSWVVNNPATTVTLLAVCGDAGTCDRLMAMYHRVVPSAKPQGMCGMPPETQVYGTSSTNFQAEGPKSDMPSDALGRCARLSACQIRSDTSTPGDPGLECQKAPAKFKLECANKPTCDDVVACTKK